MSVKMKINNKEIVLRQWFAAKYGSAFGDGPQPSWHLPKGIAELNREYSRDNPQLPISFNFLMYKLREIEIEIRTGGSFALYGDVMRSEYLGQDLRGDDDAPADRTNESVAPPAEIVIAPSRIDEMEFPTFKDYPTGTLFDRICSDDDVLRGPTSGMVMICVGESGVGKSTLLIDMLVRIEAESARRVEAGEIESATKALYVSSEMTRTDLYFYAKKSPIINSLNTLILDDYLRRGLKQALEKAFLSDDYDVVLLDSYQDTVEKLQDVCNWRAKEAENFLIELMVGAAEKKGKFVVAIQHLTKGGEYVGRTYLKHTTTAMLELRFDKEGARYMMFSKNRRCGSMMNVPMYFGKDENGNVTFDEQKFKLEISAADMSKKAVNEIEARNAKFDEIFSAARIAAEEPPAGAYPESDDPESDDA